ncbi:MAG: hypothetical protein IJP30_00035 [Clostridia bacterium]|nr:hypothetical protein [Clostridia bacterium]
MKTRKKREEARLLWVLRGLNELAGNGPMFAARDGVLAGLSAMEPGPMRRARRRLKRKGLIAFRRQWFGGMALYWVTEQEAQA